MFSYLPLIERVIKITPLSALVALLSAPAASWAVDKSSIDVLILYTQGVENRYSGDPQTRFSHLIEVANQVYADSDIGIQLNIVGTEKINYTDGGTAERALDDVTDGKSAFSGVAALRAQYNADMVVLYRVYQTSHGSCGLAWVGGDGTKGDFSGDYAKKYMYSHIGIDTCADFTTVHELGHNMGLNHSRLQDKKGGTFPYALGYGVMGKFVDVMAYTTSFKLDYWTGTVYKFSNPLITCRGLPCGVDRNKSNGADAAFTLNITGPQIANFYGGSGQALVTELEILTERLGLAEQALAEANAARDEQVSVNNSAAAALTAAKKAVDAVNKQGGKSFKSYQTKAATLTKENAALSKLAGNITTAQAKLDSSVKPAARASAAKAVTSAQTAYNKQVAKVEKLQAELDALSAQFSDLIGALTEATDTLTAATTSAKEEKTKLDTLVAAAKNADANYKAIKADYAKVSKRLK